MNLRQIEIFHAVFVHGTVSAAARSLNVSQPSVTKVLRHAERSIGLTLFERIEGTADPDRGCPYAVRRSVGHSGPGAFAAAGVPESAPRTRRPAAHFGAPLARPRRDSRSRVAVSGQSCRTSCSISRRSIMMKWCANLYEHETDIAISFEVPIVGARVASGDRRRRAGGHLSRRRYARRAAAPSPRRTARAQIHQPGAERPDRTDACRANSTGWRSNWTKWFRPAPIMSRRRSSAPGSAWRSSTISLRMPRCPRGLASRPLQPAITFDINAVYLQNRPPSRTASAFLAELATVIEAL
jgi:hypothetical protein